MDAYWTPCEVSHTLVWTKWSWHWIKLLCQFAMTIDYGNLRSNSQTFSLLILSPTPFTLIFSSKHHQTQGASRPFSGTWWATENHSFTQFLCLITTAVKVRVERCDTLFSSCCLLLFFFHPIYIGIPCFVESEIQRSHFFLSFYQFLFLPFWIVMNLCRYHCPLKQKRRLPTKYESSTGLLTST